MHLCFNLCVFTRINSMTNICLYIFTYVCMCVCVCVWVLYLWALEISRFTKKALFVRFWFYFIFSASCWIFGAFCLFVCVSVSVQAFRSTVSVNFKILFHITYLRVLLSNSLFFVVFVYSTCCLFYMV